MLFDAVLGEGAQPPAGAAANVEDETLVDCGGRAPNELVEQLGADRDVARIVSSPGAALSPAPAVTREDALDASRLAGVTARSGAFAHRLQDDEGGPKP